MINIYCDESCHLIHDKINIMVNGALQCPISEVKFINKEIQDLKIKHGLSKYNEIKWVKVSISKIDFYMELLDLFLKYDFLKFRAVIVSDKTKLRHDDYNQNHNEFYDKMYYYTLIYILNRNNSYNIYVDKKDTNTYKEMCLLSRILKRKLNDRDNFIIKKIQPIDSIESNISQLADILIGMTGYINRGLTTSAAKVQLSNYMIEKMKISFRETGDTSKQKVSLLLFNPS